MSIERRKKPQKNKANELLLTLFLICRYNIEKFFKIGLFIRKSGVKRTAGNRCLKIGVCYFKSLKWVSLIDSTMLLSISFLSSYRYRL